MLTERTARRLARWVAGCLLATAAATHAFAEEETLRYVVRKDDTLIGLGQTLFEDPAAWPLVQRLNRVANPRRIPVGSVLTIPVRLLRKVPRQGQVVFVSGAVSGDGQPIARGDVVAEGAQLVTEARSFLTIELPDGSRLTMQPQSKVRIESLHTYEGFDEAQRADFDVERGRIETEVKRQSGPAARYRIQTPTAVIGVRGTSFRVAADEAASRAEMREGTVAVNAPGGAGKAVRLTEGFGLVAQANQPLPEPVPLLEAPDISAVPALHERPLVNVELAPVAGAVAYRGQVAADAGFVQILAESRSALPSAKFDGLPDGDYYLRVRGIDSRGLEGRDAQMALRLKARPEPPLVSAPSPGGKVNAGEVKFVWSEPEGAASYRFELSRNEDLSSPLVADSVLKAATMTAALEEGTYHWRLGSTRSDGDQGPWGDAMTLIVRPAMSEVPPPSFDGNTMYFAWPGEPGQRFDYQLANDRNFDGLIAEGSVDSPEVKLDKPGPGAYYLRIRAIDPDGFVGAYSSAQKVVVPAELPSWLLGVPLLLIFL